MNTEPLLVLLLRVSIPQTFNLCHWRTFDKHFLYWVLFLREKTIRKSINSLLFDFLNFDLR